MFYNTEYPQVYSTSHIALDILRQPIVWFKPYLTGIGQMLLYRLRIKPRELSSAKDLFQTQIIKMNDGNEIKIGLSRPSLNPRAVALYLHTVCGDYTQLAHVAETLREDNIAYVTYTRSGNDTSLQFNKFNFVGRIEELQVVLQYIQVVYPNIPIHAIGASAGSALLIRYLSKYNTNKLIQSAVLVSPGYHFIKSFEKMNTLTRSYLVNKMKYTVRNLPYREELNKVKTLDDWVLFQSKMLGYESKDAYIQECDPVHHLKTINVPSIFISSLDDGIFSGDITNTFTHLPLLNSNITIVTTQRGGHVMFHDECQGDSNSWFIRVIKEWLAHHTN